MTDTARARKMSDRIHEIVAEALEKRVKDPRLGFVTVTDTRVTNDLQHATVFYTVFGDAEAKAASAAALESAKGILRSEVGKRTGIRLTPTLEFVADAIPENAAHIEGLLRTAAAHDADVAALAAAADYAGDPDPYRHDEDDAPAAEGDAPDAEPATPEPSAADPEVTDGLVVVDKPPGLTSHDVVSRVRRLAGTRKVGHAGTLDPMATGVLVLGVDRATRLLTYLVGATKSYDATIRLGVATVTDDAQGQVLERVDAAGVTDSAIRAGIAALTGELQQVPSAVSAIKVDGQRAYARVRAGEAVELVARTVTVSRFDVLDLRRTGEDDELGRREGLTVVDVDVSVDCSSGTYIRALARDLGNGLGVGGHLTALRRTRVGPYGLDRARTLDQLADNFSVLPMADAARATFPARELTEEEAQKLVHGQRLSSTGTGEVATAAFAPDGSLVAIVSDTGPTCRPLLVFAG